MITQVEFPLFVRAKDSAEIEQFNSIHELQIQVEKVDIENGEYEAWDKNGLPVHLKVQEPLWINAEPSTADPKPDQLRRALLSYGSSVGLQLSTELSVASFENALAQIRAEEEKKMLASSAMRRFFARFRQQR